ncbi:sulfatase [Arenibacter sp. ARW7G5Y1]|uniref:sulfatase family protein n=1 Tax=Arenibacter sp. ARW7G5Y1 TaxID=2135619 RepID=UPI000D768A0F|nr:sulfatase [Arenibacter sp. ARW7G5Y1]PXX21485.1 N-sulfoglucosamine sulfohydrolase [Arenibacter sp. ARW7G5Y1]
MITKNIIVRAFIVLINLTSISLFSQKATKPLNILLITADDLGYEAVNSFGRSIPDLTPNMVEFAKEGVQFTEAHTITPICVPSRAIMATGLYGVSSGMMGFIHMKKRVPTTMQVFQDNGYLTGILGKVDHSTPDPNFNWDFSKDFEDLGSGRSPQKYAEYTIEFLNRCKLEERPFYLMINSHDPHRIFHNPDGKKLEGAEEPSRLFSVDDVEIPGYLPKTDRVKLELSHYYNSVRRFDDTFGAVIEAFKNSGLYENTLIVVLSDNGSAFPFAKANCYVASTKTPFYVHYPRHMRKGLVDTEHMISEVDIFPTFLDATGIKIKNKLDGRSILPLLEGGKQRDRDFVIGEIDYKISGKATPIRSYGTKRFRYIFNPWAPTGYRYYNNNEGQINKDIEANHPEYIEYVNFFRHRVLEEFYDVQADPDGSNNLIGDPSFQKEIKKYRKALKKWMKSKNDPVFRMLKNIDKPEKMGEYIQSNFPSKMSLMTKEDQSKEIERRRRASARGLER